ncbi:MAG: ankyrin repeat protein [Alphaproteobacteria bacterium]|nr:MAG: ankyrin repeat protein [Alphaproteobacteria bacterium]
MIGGSGTVPPELPEDPQLRAEGEIARPTPEEIQQQFIDAVKNRDYDAISAALAQGADIEAEITDQQYRGYRNYGSSYYTRTYTSPLFYALEHQDGQLLAFLAAHGADVNRIDENKTSLLTTAIYKENKGFIKTIATAPSFDRTKETNKAALQNAENIKHNGPAQKELYKYVVSVLSAPWQLVDDDIISRVSFDKDGMLEVTDQFNFKAGERIRHVRDFEFGSIQTTSCFFADMPANMRAQLKEAWDELKAAGGGKNVDQQSMNTVRLRQVTRRVSQAQ